MQKNQIVLVEQGPYYPSQPGANDVFMAGNCLPCPPGFVSDGSTAASIEACVCPPGQYLNVSSNTCLQARETCGYDEYVVRPASATSDVVCARCMACPSGTFRAEGICDGLQQYDPVLRDPKGACQVCTKCREMHYMANGTCDGTGIADVDPGNAAMCRPCRTCSNLEYIQNMCPGDTFYDTQQCAACSVPCGEGQYIASQNCNGNSFDVGAIEWDECQGCQECNLAAGEIRIGGCDGHTRNPQPVCQARHTSSLQIASSSQIN